MKIAIVDDHPLVREGLSAIIACESDIELSGEAENIKDALMMIQHKNPDIVLVDIRLADESGLDIVKKAKQSEYLKKFIILTSSTEEENFYKAEKLGVDGYIFKEALPEELIYAIRLVNRGRKYYDPEVIKLKMKEDNKFTEKLTLREREVLTALGKGFSNRNIAKELFLSENTIKKHVSQILAKLELSDRTQAALYARSKGIVVE